MRLIEGTLRVDDLDATLGALDDVAAKTGATVQAFDARYVVDRAHLERALVLADRAFERGENVARDRGIEVLLYAAGRRQISRALAMGIEEGEKEVVVLVDGGDETAAAEAVTERVEETATLGAYDEALVRDYFDVGDAELAAVEGSLADLVRERVALLVVEK